LDQVLASTWTDKSGLPRQGIPDGIDNIRFRYIWDLLDPFNPIPSFSEAEVFE